MKEKAEFIEAAHAAGWSPVTDPFGRIKASPPDGSVKYTVAWFDEYFDTLWRVLCKHNDDWTVEVVVNRQDSRPTVYYCVTLRWEDVWRVVRPVLAILGMDVPPRMRPYGERIPPIDTYLDCVQNDVQRRKLLAAYNRWYTGVLSLADKVSDVLYQQWSAE